MKIKIQPGLDHITDRADLLQDFVVFVCKDLQCMPCPIDIVNGRKGAGLKTTAQYDTQNHHVMVNAKNRHFGDVLRSIAHELVHHKQNLKGELDVPVQDVGGDIEDEANARAGALLKSFAYQEGPERIYEGVDLLKAYTVLLIEQGMSVPGTPPPNQTQPSATPATTSGPPPGIQTAKKIKQKIDKTAKAMRDYIRRMSKSEYDKYIGSGVIPKAVIDKFFNPVPGSRITSPFNDPNRASHRGIDINYGAGLEGDDVLASAAGSVHFAGKRGGYGNVVIINHLMEAPGGAVVPYKTVYAHLRDVYAEKGDQVVPGTVIGSLGNTGHSRGPHVHFEIQQGSAVKDPASPAGIKSIRKQMIKRRLTPLDPGRFISFGKQTLDANEEACATVHDRLGGKNRDKSIPAPKGCGSTFAKLD